MGVKTLTINNETLALLAIQSQNLHYTLRHLGHASLDIISTHHHDTLVWQAGKLPTPLKKARAYPHYSSLDGRYDDKKAVRSELSDKLSDILLTHLGNMEKSR